MAVNLTPPSRQTGTTDEKLNGLYSYLYQLVEALNVSLNQERTAGQQVRTGGSATGAGKALADTDTETYQQLKSLIVKTAAEATGSMRKIVHEISEGYLAQDAYGTFEEYLASKISAGAEGVTFEWDAENRITTTIADYNEYLAQSGVYLRLGIVKHNDDGTIESGVLVGRNFHKVSVDGKQVYVSEDVYSLLTADQISFWQSGVCFAKLSLTGLVADQAYVDELIANEITAGNIVANMLEVNKLIASVIESEGGDASISLDGGLMAAIAKRIDLSANESIQIAVSGATAGGLETGTGVTITKDRFSIAIKTEDGDEGEEELSVDKDGVRAREVAADEIYSDSVVRVIRTADYTPANGGELASIIDELNDCSLKQDVLIDAHAVTGAVIRLHGIRGDTLTITGGTLNGVEIDCCDSLICFSGTTINAGEYAVIASYSDVELDNVSLNAQTGLSATAARCLMDNCTGTTTTLVAAYKHSDVQICGETMPYGLLICANSEVYSTGYFTEAPAAPEDSVVTTTSIAARLTRTYESGWLSTSSIGTALYQGAYGGKALRRGCMWFDLSEIAGKQIISATLTLRRVSGVGSSSAIAVGIYGTTATGASGTPAIGDKYASVSLSNGGRGTVDVTAAVQALADGTIAGLMTYDTRTTGKDGNNYTYGYCKMYGSGEADVPTLNVTYQ